MNPPRRYLHARSRSILACASRGASLYAGGGRAGAGAGAGDGGGVGADTGRSVKLLELGLVGDGEAGGGG